MLPISFASIIVAAVVNFIIGFLFHGPLFGQLWMRLANIKPTGNEKFSDMIPKMIKNFITNVVFAYALSIVYLFASSSSYLGTSGAWTGIVCAFLVWLGFVVTGSSMEVIWMGKSKKLWLFEITSSFACIVAMGAIIGAWN